MLGNGEELKRNAIPDTAPSKPPRSGSFKVHDIVNQKESGNPSNNQQSEKSEARNEISTAIASSGGAATVKVQDRQGGVKESGAPVIKVSDSLGSVPAESIEASNESQRLENSLPVVRESEAPAKAIQNGHLPSDIVVHKTKDGDERSGEVQAEAQEKEVQNQADKWDHDATQVHGEKKGGMEVQNHAETQVHNGVHSHDKEQTQDMTPNQSKMKDEPESTRSITATANTTTTTTTMTMENSTEKTTANQINESHSNSTTPKESESKPDTSVVMEQQPTRKSSFGTSKNFRAEDSLFETALLLGKLCSYQVFALEIRIKPHPQALSQLFSFAWYFKSRLGILSLSPGSIFILASPPGGCFFASCSIASNLYVCL